MRSRSRAPTFSAASCALTTILVATAPDAWSIGDGPAAIPKAPPGAPPQQQPQAPDLQAKILYNEGIDTVRRADNAAATAGDGAGSPVGTASGAAASGAGRPGSSDEARTLYSLALGKFERAVRLDPKMHEAWNYLGYTHRKLGDYDEALEAYENALALRPGYPEAIEYRAEAYLALKRFADAEQSYLDLFASHRAIADKLLEAMKSWVAAQRSAPAPG